MAAIDGVKQNDYTYTNGTNTQTQSTKSSTAPNSVYDVEPTSNVENTTEVKNKTAATILDEELEKICQKLKKYNITVEDIKKSGILNKITNLSEEQITKIPEKGRKWLLDALENAILDSIKDNKVDWEQAANLGKDYLIALHTGWSIKGFKAHNNSVKKSSLLERLIETGCLPKDTDIHNLSKEEVQEALKKFNKILCKNIKSKPTEKEALAQLQTFGRLLINSPAEEKEFFLDVIKSLYAENRAKGFDALILSCDSKEQKNDIAKKAANPEYIKEITTEPIRNEEGEIINSEVMSQDDATALAQTIYENLSEEDTLEAHENYNVARKDWFEKNKEVLASIQQKIQQAEENGTEPEFTEEEKQVLLEKQNFIIAVSSGEFLGTIENQNLSKEFKDKHLKTLNTDSYELPVYKEIIKQINTYAEQNSDNLTTPKDELTKVLDNATNGNYSTVASGSNQELNPPSMPKETEETPDFGFSQKGSIDTTRLTMLQQQIQNSTEKQTGFKVENPIKQQKTSNTLNEKMAAANSSQDKLAVIKEFFDRSPLLKQALEKYLTGMTDPLNILNALPTNARKYLAQKLVQKGQLEESDIQKLNLSFSDKQLLNNILKKKEEEKTEAVA